MPLCPGCSGSEAQVYGIRAVTSAAYNVMAAGSLLRKNLNRERQCHRRLNRTFGCEEISGIGCQSRAT